jgi:hypothetical protein
MELACTRDDITRSASQAGPAHDYFPMRKQLPYGRYNCAGGSYVLFNRDYEPLHRVHADGSSSICNPTERIAHKSKEWFYNDENPPWMDRSVFNACVQRLLKARLKCPTFLASGTKFQKDGQFQSLENTMVPRRGIEPRTP